MKIDQSYGIIPLNVIKGEWRIFLVQLHAGHWGFPKGHAENKESPFEAASRELTEETGMKVKKLLIDEIFEENYFFKQNGLLIKKNVGYFLAEVTGKTTLQVKEIAAGKWVPISEVAEWLTFDELKRLWNGVLLKVNILQKKIK